MEQMTFEEAWNNVEFRKIMHAASKHYARLIDKDDLESLQMTTLWKCLQKYNSESKMSFTTYLYTQIRYTIWNLLTATSKKLKVSNAIEVTTVAPVDSMIRSCRDNQVVSDLMESLNKEDRRLIQQRFFDNLTYEEIAKRNDFTKETARRKIKYILAKSKRLV